MRGDGYLHMTRAAAAEMFFSTGHWRADVCHRHRIFIPPPTPPEWIVAYVSVCIHWLSSVHTPRLSCRISIPPPHVGRRLLEVCNHQGWVRGGGRGGGFYYLEVKMMNWCRRQNKTPSGVSSIRAVFLNHASAWLCLSQKRTICFLGAWRSVFCFFFSVWKAGQVNVCVCVFPYHAFYLCETRLRPSPLNQTQRRG